MGRVLEESYSMRSHEFTKLDQIYFDGLREHKNISSILKKEGKKYKQIKHNLFGKDNEACALGVLISYAQNDIKTSVYISKSVVALIEYMNDKLGYTFNEIADWLKHTNQQDFKTSKKNFEEYAEGLGQIVV